MESGGDHIRPHASYALRGAIPRCNDADARARASYALRGAMELREPKALREALDAARAAGVSNIMLYNAERRLADALGSSEDANPVKPVVRVWTAGGGGVSQGVGHIATEQEEAASLLPPAPPSPRNCLATFDRGPFADPRALENEAFYIPGLLGPADDRSVFNALMEELEFHKCWLNTGMKFSRDICLGDEETVQKSPTYRAAIDRITTFFGVKPVRTLVNLYRDGNDWCNLHSDQYQSGGYKIDLTVGASFGDTRRQIWVEKENGRHKLEFPTRNGDVFAFSDHINNTWRHMVPREEACGPRLSVIVWCSRSPCREDASTAEAALGSFPHMLYSNPRARGRDFEAGGGWTKAGS